MGELFGGFMGESFFVFEMQSLGVVGYFMGVSSDGFGFVT